jgi:hypothetical protein
MKTILLLGAGITRARLTAAIQNRPPLDCDFFDISLKVYPKLAQDVLGCLETLVGDYAASLRQSLEISTTYLYIKAIDSKTHSIYHRSFLNLLNLLGYVLAKTTNSIRIGPRSLLYRFLLSELRKVDTPEDLTIITFNYDLLLERTLQEIAERGHKSVFVFPGCYRLDGISRIQSVSKMPEFTTEVYDHTGVGLLKLHGSMNWQSKHTSSTPTPAAMFNPNRELHILDSPMISPLLSWRRKKRSIHMKPVIVPPISGKRGMMHRDIVPLWEKAGKALTEADRIVIAGYSCPPLDLEARILLGENLRVNSSKKVYVIDPSPTTASRFVDLCGVDHITLYTSIDDWVRDAIP